MGFKFKKYNKSIREIRSLSVKSVIQTIIFLIRHS